MQQHTHAQHDPDNQLSEHQPESSMRNLRSMLRYVQLPGGDRLNDCGAGDCQRRDVAARDRCCALFGTYGGIDDSVSCDARTSGGNHTDYFSWHPHPVLTTGGAHGGHHPADPPGHRHQSPLWHAAPALEPTCCASQKRCWF